MAEERVAHCWECGKDYPLDKAKQMLFTPRPEREKDEVYDGCRGWD